MSNTRLEIITFLASRSFSQSRRRFSRSDFDLPLQTEFQKPGFVGLRFFACVFSSGEPGSPGACSSAPTSTALSPSSGARLGMGDDRVRISDCDLPSNAFGSAGSSKVKTSPSTEILRLSGASEGVCEFLPL